MFLRIVLFIMILSVAYARNPELSDDHVPPPGTPCSEEGTSHHHQRDIKHAAALNDNNPALPMINSAKNNEEQSYPLKMQLKKIAVADHESHTIGPKPGCCG